VLTTKVVIPVVVAVLGALLVAVLTPVGDKVKELLFPTKVTVTGRVLVAGQPTGGVRLALDGNPIDSTDEQGEFVLEGVGKGAHRLALRKVGTWLRTYKFTVGATDKTLNPIQLEPLVIVRFVVDEGSPAAIIDYEAYVWLRGRPKAMKRVKSVRYTLPVWVGRTAAKGAPQKPFCYAIAGEVDFGLLGQHSGDPVIATVKLRDGGRFKIAGVPNLPGPAHPNCSLSGASGGGGAAGGGGSAERPVPSVIGQSFENASLALEELDFAVVRIDVESNHPAGEVVGQSPEGGALQPPGTTITLSVSKGSSAMTMVPDVTGRTEGDARARLESDGFIMSISGGVICDSNQKIVVTTQDPSGGTQAIPGSTVKVALGCA
jgi:hypothetical protein